MSGDLAAAVAVLVIFALVTMIIVAARCQETPNTDDAPGHDDDRPFRRQT